MYTQGIPYACMVRLSTAIYEPYAIDNIIPDDILEHTHIHACTHIDIYIYIRSPLDHHINYAVTQKILHAESVWPACILNAAMAIFGHLDISKYMAVICFKRLQNTEERLHKVIECVYICTVALAGIRDGGEFQKNLANSYNI